MNLKEYERSKKFLYKEFSKLVKQLLEKNIPANEYKLMLIQFREKSALSLKNKLIKDRLLKSNNIEKKIKDLAGCRIIFYRNQDVQKFISSNILRNTFKLTEEFYKIHHPQDSVQSSNDLYMADHFIVELTDKKTSSQKNKKYKGLRCEIQVCTVLNHAFAETNHDSIYKRFHIKNYGNKTLNNIERQLISLGMDHLIPSGHEIDHINSKYQQLCKGKLLLESDILKKINLAKNNHEIYAILDEFNKNTLPNYDDLTLSFNEIIKIIKNALVKSKNSKDIKFKIGSNRYSGKTKDDVAKLCFYLFNRIRYANPDRVFRELIKIYLENKPTQQTEVIKVVRNLASYDYYWLRNNNYSVQKLLLEHIKNSNSLLLAKIKPLDFIIIEEILKYSIAWNEIIDIDTTSIHRATLQGSQELFDLKMQAVTYLTNTYALTDDNIEKLKILQILNSASKLPSLPPADDSLLIVITKIHIEIVRFYSAKVSKNDMHLNFIIESNLFSLFKISKSIIKRLKSNIKLTKEAKLLVGEIDKFRNSHLVDKEYLIFKTLIGSKIISGNQWLGKVLGYRESEALRDKRMKSFIAAINNSNQILWKNRIIYCISNSLINRRDCFPFNKFLELLGEMKPKFAYDLLINNSQAIAHYIDFVLVGLLKSHLTELTKTLIMKWISEGLYLNLIVWVIYYRFDSFDIKLITLLQKKLSIYKDINSTNNLISILISNFSMKKCEIKKIFFMALAFLTRFKDARWTESINTDKLEEFIFNLNQSESIVILKNLVYSKRICYSQEIILEKIANSYPQEVISFFRDRLEYTPKNNIFYDELPDDISILRPLLSPKNPHELIKNVISWCNYDKYKFEHSGARFLKLLFPAFTTSLNYALCSLLKSDTKNLDYIVIIIGKYKGDAKIHKICKEIIELTPKSDVKLEKIKSVLLGESDLISTQGKFGMTEYYKNIKKYIHPWLRDKNKRINAFAVSLMKRIDNSISYNKRLTEQSIERQKRSLKN